MKLSKTDYILWRECKKNAWMKWHRRDEYDKFELSEFEQALLEQGNQIEEVARTRWEGGILIERRSQGAVDLTKKLVAKQERVIFQAAFETEEYFVAADVIVWNSTAEMYDLYEIKMSASEKGRRRQYDYDIGFQKMIIEMCGVPINNTYLLKLNANYVRHGDLNVHELFSIDDKTEQVGSLKAEIVQEAQAVIAYLRNDSEPEGHCDCFYRGRSSHCTTFSLSNPGVPAYSVHDLNRIGASPAKLRALLNAGIIRLDDVPSDADISDRHHDQVRVHKTKEPLVDIESIKRELDGLVFPLYFLDYETYPSALPIFEGYHPYQHVVFQYSLHILREAGGELEHKEFLQTDGLDPAGNLSASLSENIGPIGSVIVWYKTFENSRNKELGKMLPAYLNFYQDVIGRTYDLMDIVEHQHYIHPGFKGRSSIKIVLPVLAPELSYKELEVRGGTDAIEGYRQITAGELTGAALESKIADMLAYCKLDTFAMVRIWQEFMKLIKPEEFKASGWMEGDGGITPLPGSWADRGRDAGRRGDPYSTFKSRMRSAGE